MSIKYILIFSLCFLCLSCSANEPATLRGDIPHKSYEVGIELPSQLNMQHSEITALKDLGLDYINYYVNTFTNAGDMPAMKVNQYMMDIADSLRVNFSISCSVYDTPNDVLEDAVKRYKGTVRFKGNVIDEFDHARFIYPSSYGINRYLINPLKLNSLEDAHAATLEAFKTHRDSIINIGVPNVTSTHVWEVLNQFAAKTGYVVCPKICKETYSSVSMAIGLGAALQYSASSFWNDIDLWWWDIIPGHPAEEIVCNLLFSYWMGADLTYIEGCGYNLYPAGKQGLPFSLFICVDDTHYQFTSIGKVLKWFTKVYVPNHPRSYTWRDLKPNIAIIRYEDSDFGQVVGLYGNNKWKRDADTRAWIQIFDLLTFGATGTNALTHSNKSDPHYFFYPMNGAVEYDENVGYNLLQNIPLLFLTGKHVSLSTMDVVRQCVQNGAICVIWGNLARNNGFESWTSGTTTISEGKGKFIITDNFESNSVRYQINPLIGNPDEIRYKFGTNEVVLKKVNNNAIDVSINGVVQQWNSFKWH